MYSILAWRILNADWILSAFSLFFTERIPAAMHPEHGLDPQACLGHRNDVILEVAQDARPEEQLGLAHLVGILVDAEEFQYGHAVLQRASAILWKEKLVPLGEFLVTIPGRVPSARDPRHLEDAAALELMQNECVVKAAWAAARRWV